MKFSELYPFIKEKIEEAKKVIGTDANMVEKGTPSKSYSYNVGIANISNLEIL